MASKSPLNIVEDALTAVLSANTSLSAYTVFKGCDSAKLTLPSIIVSCESASFPPELPQGLGNYVCRVKVGVFTQIDDQTQTNHRDAVQEAMGTLDDVAQVKASFNSIGDASCYDNTMTGLNEETAERAFMTSLTYDCLIVLPPV
jgi:hypothetical protein